MVIYQSQITSKSLALLSKPSHDGYWRNELTLAVKEVKL